MIFVFCVAIVIMRSQHMENVHMKYPRTLHLEWSQGATNDDKISFDTSKLINNPIVITEKLDGSNTSLERLGCFARTHAGPPTHASFDGLKALHASVSYKIPDGIQCFGEWAQALHSIAYDKLPGYFLMFNVRDLEKQEWLSWDDVCLWADELSVPTVPVLFKGIISSEKELKLLTKSLMKEPSVYGDIREGVVIRIEDGFKDEEFSSCCLKMVRKNHVTTSEHWSHNEIVKNKLADGSM